MHRDIKPENILIRKNAVANTKTPIVDTNIVLADFGLATFLN